MSISKQRVFNKGLIPKKLYKYCSSKIFEEKILKDQIQFGRASYYRRMYHEGASFGDRFEGAPSNVATRDIIGRDSEFSKKLYEKTDGHVVFTGTLTIKSGALFTMEFPDFFLFSLSTMYNADTHRKFFASDHYDLCLELDSFLDFASHIRNHLDNGVSDVVVISGESTCKYIMRSDFVEYVDVPGDVEGRSKLDVFCKDKNVFGGEAEYRIALQFKPDIQTPDPEFFRPIIPKIADHFRIYNKIE